MNDVEVLYVEDDATDADFAKVTINEIGCGRLKMSIIPDGQAAAEALGVETGSTQAVRVPHMILLDLNLPKISGTELLRRIKAPISGRSGGASGQSDPSPLNPSVFVTCA